ncbi:MAG TPA: hypothetical protein VMU42_08275 [Candidatus Sulfotelmatobacter sp.]|nr:hypothetical protein [Candidatus Sulfotelmatobacter sp.]
MHKLVMRLVPLWLAFMLGACATVTTGTSETVTVITDPAGATCKLTRNGQAVGVINPSPGSVRLDKSKDDVAITCSKDGYVDGNGTLSSYFQGMTAGNLILGGLVGVVVDAASGAMTKYPESINVVLLPVSFPTAAARDDFYAKRRADIASQADAALAEQRKSCNPSDQLSCNSRLDAVTKKRDADLAALEVQRGQARVDPGAAAAAPTATPPAAPAVQTAATAAAPPAPAAPAVEEAAPKVAALPKGPNDGTWLGNFVCVPMSNGAVDGKFFASFTLDVVDGKASRHVAMRPGGQIVVTMSMQEDGRATFLVDGTGADTTFAPVHAKDESKIENGGAEVMFVWFRSQCNLTLKRDQGKPVKRLGNN